VPPRTARRRRFRALGREASAFLVVGAVALAVDVGLFNLLVHVGDPGPLAGSPLTAKALSVTASTTVAYVGNRTWTYRHRPRGRVTREYVLFVVLSAIALGIALGCLAVSRYVLGLTSALADNVSANVVGLALGTAFRFLSYRRWVFRREPAG
jgi:putative flippase GtrA